MNKELQKINFYLKMPPQVASLGRLGPRAARVFVYHLLWKNQIKAIPVTGRGGT
jgi:hypothetical protein